MRSRVSARSQLQGQRDWLVVACCEQAVSATEQQEQHQWLHFFNVFTNLSTSPLARGQRGVTFRCLKPSTNANFANSSPLNGGPLSDLTTRGAPNVENS